MFFKRATFLASVHILTTFTQVIASFKNFLMGYIFELKTGDLKAIQIWVQFLFHKSSAII
jgi:hypothetical protein